MCLPPSKKGQAVASGLLKKPSRDPVEPSINNNDRIHIVIERYISLCRGRLHPFVHPFVIHSSKSNSSMVWSGTSPPANPRILVVSHGKPSQTSRQKTWQTTEKESSERAVFHSSRKPPKKKQKRKARSLKGWIIKLRRIRGAARFLPVCLSCYSTTLFVSSV